MCQDRNAVPDENVSEVKLAYNFIQVFDKVLLIGGVTPKRRLMKS